MRFSEILGQEHIKNHLQQSAKNGRIPHAQLFIGKEGSGTLATAIAYAQFLLCNENENSEACNLKCDNLAHPDLHFSFPVTTNDKVKSPTKPISNLFIEEWRQFLKEQPYGNLFNWLHFIGVENKQGNISVHEAKSIVKSLQLKSYEGGFKVMLIWMAEKMNIEAANKLLKLLEEPPEKTVFILIAENEEQIISTIRSRCQVLHFPVLGENDIVAGLIAKENITKNEAQKIAHQCDGNFNKALHLLNNNSSEIVFEEWFITWIRAAFKAKGNASVINELIGWSDAISKTGRETQKRFLNYCLQFFRQALLLNYKANDLVFLETKTPGFKLQKFAPFVHGSNIMEIDKELNDAIYHIERNGNAKIILLDLSIKLTRLLHAKEN
ncbi:MAG: DNA polymerase III subunit delta' [Flavobacteriaceae bacterium]|nr:MAG: DNA polymerase III subunit delta' [Flavobacteriaceae bacterium]